MTRGPVIGSTTRPWTAVVSLVLALTIPSFVSGGPQAGVETETPAPLAAVNGDVITGEDLEHALGGRLRQLEQEVYELKRKRLDSLIAERLLIQEATKRGLKVAALVDIEVTAKVGLVTEQDVETFYHANKDRLRGEEAVLPQQIRTYLQQQKLAAQRAEFVESLRSQTKIGDRLPSPRMRPFTGAQPLEAFVRVIDEELTAGNNPPTRTQ